MTFERVKMNLMIVLNGGMPEMGAQLHTIASACAELRISRSSLLRLIAKGEVKAIRPTPHTVRITAVELERFVAEREAEAQPA